MVLTRRKILKDKALENQQDPNYLPNSEDEPHRDMRPDEIELEELSENEGVPLRMSQDSRTFTDRVIQEHHKIKTYSDLGRECYGNLGYYSVNVVIFIQQLTIVTAYFFFLDKFFPSYLSLLLMAPI